MSDQERFVRLLRWYPPAWRARYGDEMTALLEDTHGLGDVPIRQRLALAKAGTVERARTAGVLGDAAGAGERLRAGSMLVLCAWALFIVAGSVFAKFTDQWATVTPDSSHRLPDTAFTVVQWAGTVGTIVVLAAACVALPSCIRLLRSGGWSSIRRPVLRALGVGAGACFLTLGLVVAAHHLSAHDRNGGSVPYEALFVLWGVVVIAAIGTSTGAAVSVGRRLDLARRTLRIFGCVALVLALTMGAIITSIVVWWAAVAAAAPRVLHDGLGNGIPFSSDTVPPTLVVVGFLMVIGLIMAGLGAVRIAPALRPGRPDGAVGLG